MDVEKKYYVQFQEYKRQTAEVDASVPDIYDEDYEKETKVVIESVEDVESPGLADFDDQHKSLMMKLPGEIIASILQWSIHLDLRNCTTLALTCKKMHSILKHNRTSIF